MKLYYFSVHNSSLCLPPLSQMTPGSNEQLGASEAWAPWELCQGELAQFWPIGAGQESWG